MAKGVDSSVALKRQASWGGAFATTGMYEYPFTAEGFKKIVERDRSNNISSGRSYASRFTKGKYTVGRITGDMLYTRVDHLIASILGLPTTVVGAGGDVGAFTNTYAPLSTMQLLDVQVSKGNIPTGKIFKFGSMMVKALEFRWNDRGAMTIDAELFGKDETSTATTGSDPATSNVTLVKDLVTVGSQMTTVDIGTGADDAYCVKSGKIRLEQKISENDYCNGSDTPALPDADDFLNVTGEFTIKFVDRGVYEDYVSQNDMTGEIKCVSTSLVVGGGTLFRTIDFLINKFNYTSDDGGLVLVDKPGILIAKVGWEAYGIGGSSATAEPIAIKTINEIKGDTLL